MCRCWSLGKALSTPWAEGRQACTQSRWSWGQPGIWQPLPKGHGVRWARHAGSVRHCLMMPLLGCSRAVLIGFRCQSSLHRYIVWYVNTIVLFRVCIFIVAGGTDGVQTNVSVSNDESCAPDHGGKPMTQNKREEQIASGARPGIGPPSLSS